MDVEDFPVTVVNDIYGGDLYEEGKGNRLGRRHNFQEHQCSARL
jgi:tartrate dehydratase beta subunit/fumarate hydratase class I family protein